MNDSGLLKWLADHLWAAGGALVAVTWGLVQRSINSQGEGAAKALAAHAAENERQFRQLHEEQNLLRGHIGRLFDKLEVHTQRAEDRHRELLTAMHTALNSKADK